MNFIFRNIKKRKKMLEFIYFHNSTFPDLSFFPLPLSCRKKNGSGVMMPRFLISTQKPTMHMVGT